MAVKPVLKMGDPILYQVAQSVTVFNTSELNQLIDDMSDTMNAEDGAGLAAPQIGVSKRVVIFGIESNPRYPDADDIPMTVLINPKIEMLTEEQEDGWEGCLSVPGLRGMVPRFTQIRYSGVDPQGKTIERTVEGFHARVVQHECDHLDGILYPMRMRDIRMLGYTDVLFPEVKENQTPESEEND